MKLLKTCGITLALLGFALGSVYANGNTDKGAAQTTSSGKTKVTVWTLWTDTTQDVNSIAFHKALESAVKDLPDIQIEHDATENEAYKTKIKTAMAAGDAPDVFYAWGAGFVKPFVDAGKVVPLDDYLKDGTAAKLKGGANTNFTFNGKTYGLTFTQWVAGLYCDKALFDKYNVKLPNTYEDLMAAVKAFKAAGVIPITVGEKDRWPGMFWQNAFAIRTAGADTCNAALAGKAPFNTPEFVRSAQLLADLVSAGAFVDGALGLTSDEAQALFLQRKAAMYYMGSWFAGNIAASDNGIVNDVVVQKFPTISDQKGDATQFLGGAIDGLCVSQNAKDKTAAARVTKYLMEQTARNLAKTGDGLPTWNTDDVVPAKSNPVATQFAQMVKGSTGYVLAWDTFLSGADADDHKNFVAAIFGGTMTPKDFAASMQAISDKNK